MATKYQGITPPVNLREASANEVAILKDLVQYRLHNLDLYESEAGLEQRNQILCKIEDLLCSWISGISKDRIKKKTDDVRHNYSYGSRILPFGGQAIGVVSKGGDIDALCLAPNFIKRDDFFHEMFDILSQCEEINNLRKVEAAYVPVIKFTCSNISVDLSLSVLRYQTIPLDVSYSDKDILINMDVVSVRSMSGIRDAALLLSLVPDIESYRNTLKVVKTWAIAKGLHTSAMGYPGGIVWSIMVARVCQMFPLASVCVLVCNFFVAFCEWSWPKPVLLRELDEEAAVSGLQQWNSKVHHADRHHLMPVITPAYPEHNCAFSVNKSARDVIVKQLHEGKSISEKILEGKEGWETLFQPINFFNMYKHFLMLTANTHCQEIHLDWSGFIESQIRKLVEKLESQDVIQLLHLYTNTYRKVNSSYWFIGMKLNKTESSVLNISTPSIEFSQSVKSIAVERGIWKEGMNITLKHLPRKQLAQYVNIDPAT